MPIEEKDHEGDHAKECTGGNLPELVSFLQERLSICRGSRLSGRRQAGPRNVHPSWREEEIRDHRDVMKIVIVGRGHVDPAAASKRTGDACRSKYERAPRGAW